MRLCKPPGILSPLNLFFYFRDAGQVSRILSAQYYPTCIDSTDFHSQDLEERINPKEWAKVSSIDLLGVLQFKRLINSTLSGGKFYLADYCFVIPCLFLFYFSQAKLCLRSHLHNSALGLYWRYIFQSFCSLHLSAYNKYYHFIQTVGSLMGHWS